jgi:periplasmic protein TonB
MLFEESLIETLPQNKKGRVRFFLAGTVAGYSFVVAGLIVSSILWANPQFNEAVMGSTLLASPPPPPPPPPPAAATQSAAQVARPRIITTSFVPPTVTPRQLPDASDLPAVDVASGGGVPGGVAGGVPGGVMGGVVGGVIGGVLGATPVAVAPPPPVVPKSEPVASPETPRAVSTGILLGNTIRQVQPTYPQLAQKAHIEGVVEVHVIVDEMGNVVAAEALNGHPLLRQPAIAAALQWKFRPTLLNGRPIKVTGTLKFTFKLG